MKGSIDQVLEDAKKRRLAPGDGRGDHTFRGRGPHPRGRGVQRRGSSSRPGPGRRGRHPRQPRADARLAEARPSCGCKISDSETKRYAQAHGLAPGLRQPRPGPGRARRPRPRTSTPRRSEPSSPTPSRGSRRPRRTAPPGAAQPRTATAAEAFLEDRPRAIRAATCVGRALAERLIGYDTSDAECIHEAARASSRAGSRPAAIEASGASGTGPAGARWPRSAPQDGADGRPARPPRRRPRARRAVRAADSTATASSAAAPTT